jgi:hypothetical protein
LYVLRLVGSRVIPNLKKIIQGWNPEGYFTGVDQR